MKLGFLQHLVGRPLLDLNLMTWVLPKS